MAAMAIAGFILAGCGKTGELSADSPRAVFSPLAGKWSGKSDMKGNDLDKFANSIAGGPLTGSSY